MGASEALASWAVVDFWAMTGVRWPRISVGPQPPGRRRTVRRYARGLAREVGSDDPHQRGKPGDRAKRRWPGGRCRFRRAERWRERGSGENSAGEKMLEGRLWRRPIVILPMNEMRRNNGDAPDAVRSPSCFFRTFGRTDILEDINIFRNALGIFRLFSCVVGLVVWSSETFHGKLPIPVFPPCRLPGQGILLDLVMEHARDIGSVVPY